MRHHTAEALRVTGENEKVAHNFMASMCKVGYQNNLFLAQNLANMEFLPGDEQTADLEENMSAQGFEDVPFNNTQREAEKEAQNLNDASLKELLKIVMTPDYPVVEHKEKIDGPNNRSSIKGSDGNEYKGGGNSKNTEPKPISPQDWYNSLFNRKPGTEIPPRKDGEDPSSPPISPSQEGK